MPRRGTRPTVTPSPPRTPSPGTPSSSPNLQSASPISNRAVLNRPVAARSAAGLQISHSEKFDKPLAQKGLALVSQLTLYNAARPPPGPPELRRLRSVGRVPPPGILRRLTPARNRAGSGPFCILHSLPTAWQAGAFFLSPIRPPGLRPQRPPRRLPPEGGEPGTPPSGGR